MSHTVRTMKTNVLCPYSNGKPMVVYTLYTTNEHGEQMFAPCNGCEHMNGSETCQRCRAYVTLVLQGMDYSSLDTSGLAIVGPSASA